MSHPWSLFGQLLAGILQPGATGPPPKRRPKFRPAVEGMEDRCLLSGGLLPASAVLAATHGGAQPVEQSAPLEEVGGGTVIATISEPDPNFTGRVTGSRQVTLTPDSGFGSRSVPVRLEAFGDGSQVFVVLDKPLPVKGAGLFLGTLTINNDYTNSSDQLIQTQNRVPIGVHIKPADLVPELAPLTGPARHPGKPKPPKHGKRRHPRRGHVRRPGQGVSQLPGGNQSGLQGVLPGGGATAVGGGGGFGGSSFGGGSGFGGAPSLGGGGGFA
jgi:hypothetical protein